ncbi:MAG: class I SAM-dependent methyltransferase [Pseudomonadota bacterium]
MFGLWKRYLPRRFKRRAMVYWYDAVARMNTRGDLLFLNHGYAEPEHSANAIPLPPELEDHRFPIQLYDLLARRGDWDGKDGLEVSCGLGGGVMFLDRCYRPRTMTGLDISTESIAACRRRYDGSRLRFEVGDAQAMPFSDNSFDIVMNVESSLNYPDFSAFLREVDRVLKPGGKFLFADYRRSGKMARLRQTLSDMGYDVELMTDITSGIVRGLELGLERKRALIDRHVAMPLRGIVRGFAGLSRGRDEERDKFRDGVKSYLMAVMTKPYPEMARGPVVIFDARPPADIQVAAAPR